VQAKLAAAVAGSLDATGELRLHHAGQAGVAFDLARETVTGLAAPAAAGRNGPA